ncbi:MFS general substrate transporter [Pleomassaria siparia CBS 279.74]|uniref:MFS general substrate transporter n=1 Tax=Pleomassaria siparia CBS 279.74 TaxID=1314801 RepID=A0A6G1JVN5_9PLEO|nr:MFS general substrate transporter [Pleomassaria siparia CBS 279.74]
MRQCGSTFRIREEPIAMNNTKVLSIMSQHRTNDTVRNTTDKVDFDGPDDTYNPQNWSFNKKALNTFLYGLTTLSSTWASAAYSPANDIVAKEYNVPTDIAILGTSLLFLGFGFGPLVWAPLSEVYGRKWTTVALCFVAALFSFATGVSSNVSSIMITRFFCGFFGAAPIICTGGAFADMWDATQRGNAIVGYALAVAAGPIVAPLVGGAIMITGILQVSIVVLEAIWISESYTPRLLICKACQARTETGDQTLRTELEEQTITLYASFIYGVFYTSLASFPIIFQQDRGWDPLTGSLPFLALLIGIVFGSVLNVRNQIFFYNHRWAARTIEKSIPEARLPPMMLGSFFSAGGIFVLGWTSHPRFHWAVPTRGAMLVGFGYYTIFQSALNYLVDTFQQWGASAIVAKIFLRSILAAAFPAIVIPIYHKLETGPASSCFA